MPPDRRPVRVPPAVDPWRPALRRFCGPPTRLAIAQVPEVPRAVLLARARRSCEVRRAGIPDPVLIAGARRARPDRASPAVDRGVLAARGRRSGAVVRAAEEPRHRLVS